MAHKRNIPKQNKLEMLYPIPERECPEFIDYYINPLTKKYNIPHDNQCKYIHPPVNNLGDFYCGNKKEIGNVKRKSPRKKTGAFYIISIRYYQFLFCKRCFCNFYS